MDSTRLFSRQAKVLSALCFVLEIFPPLSPTINRSASMSSSRAGCFFELVLLAPFDTATRPGASSPNGKFDSYLHAPSKMQTSSARRRAQLSGRSCISASWLVWLPYLGLITPFFATSPTMVAVVDPLRQVSPEFHCD